MSGTHTTGFPIRRYGFIAGAATLLVVLVSWVAVRAVGPTEPEHRVPLLVQPTMPLGGFGPTAIPWGPGSTIPLLSAPPTPAKAAPAPPRTTPAARVTTTTPTTTTTAAATRKPTTKPAPTRTTSSPTPAPPPFSARYSTPAEWDQGFIGNVAVTNTGAAAANWTVKVTYDSRAGVRLGNTWNAQVSRQGSTFVLTGGPLAPGATVTLGYEAAKQFRGQVRPTGCTVDGASCRMG